MDPLLRPFVEITEEGSPLVPITFVTSGGLLIVGAVSPRGAFSDSVRAYLDELAARNPAVTSLRELLAKFRAFVPSEEADERYITLQNVTVHAPIGKHQIPMMRLDLDSVSHWSVGPPQVA